MAIKPLGSRVLIKIVDAEAKTKGGIYVPDTAKEKPQEAEVVSVGEGKSLKDGSRQKPQVRKGDRILFGKYSGTEVTTKKGESYVMIKEDDILAIIT